MQTSPFPYHRAESLQICNSSTRVIQRWKKELVGNVGNHPLHPLGQAGSNTRKELETNVCQNFSEKFLALEVLQSH